MNGSIRENIEPNLIVPPHLRPTPPHLTSVLAEQLLARACENEADNAKRMRMGMEPVSQVPMMRSRQWLIIHTELIEETRNRCSV